MTIRSFAVLVLLLSGILTPALWAGQPPSPARGSIDPVAPAQGITPAEEISRLESSIAASQEQIRSLSADRDDPRSEYARAKAAFERIDRALQERKLALQNLAPGNLAGRRDIGAQVSAMETQRTLAKDRFDLAIEARRAAAEQIANLQQMLQRDRKEVQKLQSATPSPDAEVDAPPASSQMKPPSTEAPAAPPAIAPLVNTPAATATPTTPAEVPTEPTSHELSAAQKDVKRKLAAEKAADAEARSATELLKRLDREVVLEKQLLQTARKQREIAARARDALTADFRQRSIAGAPKPELDGILDQVQRAERRLETANAEAQKHVTRLEELQTERASVQAEQLDDMKQAQLARQQVQAAENEVRWIENPFRLHNILLWLIDHGPKMLAVLLAMILSQWAARHFCDRVILLIAQKGARGTAPEREDRARTLVGVFYNATSVAILLGGGLMLLQEAGIPVAPLLGGAAVFGLAVAFSAQNLIRDYFYGFVILLENQYKLNDVVQIGTLSGQVEKITLRMTVLRDLEGRVHFIPNGQITAVTNMTHGWSRALFDIGVAYKEDVDRVIGVLSSLAHDLRSDPQFGPLILEDATMLGVDSLADSAVMIKFFIKTRPLQQWAIRRELLRRIKNRFDELGIEIPYPHRTVYHRTDQGAPIEATHNPPRILYGHP